MPEKLFLKRLSFLWVGIVVVRLILAHKFTIGGLPPIGLTIAFLMFVLAIAAIEIRILIIASREFLASPESHPNPVAFTCVMNRPIYRHGLQIVDRKSTRLNSS